MTIKSQQLEHLTFLTRTIENLDKIVIGDFPIEVGTNNNNLVGLTWTQTDNIKKKIEKEIPLLLEANFKSWIKEIRENVTKERQEYWDKIKGEI